MEAGRYSRRAHLANALRALVVRSRQPAGQSVPPSGGRKDGGTVARRTLAQRVADAEAQAARLRDQYRKAERRADARRKIVIAGAMLAEARDDPDFDRRIREIVQRRVTRREDVEAVREWLSTI